MSRPHSRPLARLACFATLFATLIAGLAITAAVAAPAADGDGDAPANIEASATLPALPAHPVPAPLALDPSIGNPATRNGREIYRRFREGLDDPTCDADDVSARWSDHFAAAPRRLARRDDTLALFGFVVDAVREASMPTEFALIPFVESGYKPGARSPLGAAGLWQMIEITARDHEVPIRNGYDGRLSPVDSTRAAVAYLKHLYGMFAGDWRLAAMAYNAGEYRILRSLRRGDQVARSADPATLPGLPSITHAYVRKLHALSCLMLQSAEQADQRDAWLAALDRPVPRLQAVTLPADIDRLAQWAARNDQDAERLRRLNPVYTDGRIRRHGDDPAPLLAPALARAPSEAAVSLAATATSARATGPLLAASAGPGPAAASGPRTHTVARGDTLSTLAEDYGVSLEDLLRRNDLTAGSLIRPGMVLQLDAAAPANR